MDTNRLRLALGFIVVGGSAHGAVITYRGDTVSQPTFNRPLEDLSGLSGVGTATRYDTRTFSVTQSGAYDFTSVATFDPFLVLYSPGFNPVTPLSNGVVANDDLVGFNSSGFSTDLVAGTPYVAVMAGFGNADAGAYAVSIGGIGEFTPIASSAPSPDVFVLSGSTLGKPTYNRPLEALSGLSGVGTATPYDVLGFTVDATGVYDLAGSAAFDPFLTLYQSSFDPSAPLANAVVANDDIAGFGSVGVGLQLTAGLSYFAVTSGFGNNDTGAYSLLIAGAGQVTTTGPNPPPTNVPEPSTWAVMLAGLAWMGGMVRRRAA